MAAKSHVRGHEVVFMDGEWCYADTGELASAPRPCKRCGKPPTPEGHDACLGKIDGVVAGCCGHGVEEGYLIYKHQTKGGIDSD